MVGTIRRQVCCERRHKGESIPIGQGNVELTISSEFPSEGKKKPSRLRSTKASSARSARRTNRSARGSQRGPPVALLGIKTTDFPRRFLCCLLPLPIQCTHKPKRELVNVSVRDTALLRICGKSVRHFLTGGSGTGFEKEWILLKIIFF